MDIPDNIINKNIYKQVKLIADKIYKRHGLFKSAFIQKEYQKLGGKYKDKKPSKNEGINRWLLGEQWIEVKPYLEKNEIVKCGSSNRKGKACRPLKRVNEKTPITIPELLKIHSKKKILDLVNQKIQNMNKRINWNKAIIS
jgi:hypothetical protein